MLKNSQIKKKISDKIALREAKKVLALDKANEKKKTKSEEVYKSFSVKQLIVMNHTTL